MRQLLDVDIASARSEDVTSDDNDFSWLMGHLEPHESNMGRDIAGVSIRMSIKIFLQPSESREDDIAVKSSSTFALPRKFCFV